MSQGAGQDHAYLTIGEDTVQRSKNNICGDTQLDMRQLCLTVSRHVHLTP